MLLRIEDTDRERSTAAAINAIIDGLSWLGINWDGEIVFQFSRAARHRQVGRATAGVGPRLSLLLQPEELAAMREKARAEGRTRLYDGRCRDRSSKDAPAGINPVIRLRHR